MNNLNSQSEVVDNCQWLAATFYCSCLKRLQVHLKHEVKPTGQANILLPSEVSTYFPTPLVHSVKEDHDIS